MSKHTTHAKLAPLPEDESRKRSLLILRRIIGWSGFFLPLLCFLEMWIFKAPWLRSISAYYYTPVHDLFVGILFMLAVALWSYIGYEKAERYLAGFAGTCAFLVAFSPTSPSSYSDRVVHTMTGFEGLNTYDFEQVLHYVEFVAARGWGLAGEYVHAGSAALLFLSFAVFSGAFFTRTEQSPAYPVGFLRLAWQVLKDLAAAIMPGEQLGHAAGASPEKAGKNRVYRNCARGIIGALVGVVALCVYEQVTRTSFGPIVFVGEWVALWAFACSWIVKSETDFGPTVRTVKILAARVASSLTNRQSSK